MEPTPTYPAQWETHVVLRDGSTAEIRPIRPTDRDALTRFHSQQSRESIYFRYFRYRPQLSDTELEHFTVVDYQDRMAFVAMQGNELVAVARYETWPDRPVAEVAFFVHDDHHGKGLGTLLLEYLAAAGRQRGLAGFTASVLPENYRMLGVFRSAGFETSTRFEDGVIEVELGIDVTAETSSAMADRQRSATARSVARLLQARTVAVIGASREPGTVGHELVRHLLSAGQGAERPVRVLAVNPSADRILGLPCHETIGHASAALAAGPGSTAPVEGRTGADDEDTGGIDLAVVAVRAELVVDVVRQCAAVGVRGLLVVSSGFAEVGPDGEAREREMVEVARDNGMRLIGPAAFGLISTVGPGPLCAVFHPVTLEPGRVAVGSQSGPLGAAMLDQLAANGLGVSSFVGVGNRSDVSINDLLDHWSLDSATDLILLYVENFGNLRNFSAAARRTSLAKPIITIRPSSPDEVELLRQAGVIVVDEVSQLVEQAELAASQPPARGNRVAVVSNSASVARLATAACRRHGLRLVVPVSVADAARDDSVLIGDLDSVALRPSGVPDDYERVVVAAAVSDEVDQVLLALVPTAYLELDQLEELLDRVNRAIDKPVVAVGLVDSHGLRAEGLPVFSFPEEAARALGRHARYGLWRAARVGPRAEPSALAGAESESETRSGDRTEAEDREGLDGAAAVDAERAGALIDRLLAGRRETTLTMTSPDLPSVLDALGIPLARWGTANDVDEAAALAAEIGFPVALKAANLSQRSVGESGGTAIDLHDAGELRAAHRRMSDQLGPMAMRTLVVQRMLASTRAVRLELLQDPAFGAMVSIGPGGAAYGRGGPSSRRFLPLDVDEARSLVRSVADHDPAAAVGAAAEPAVVELVERLVGAAGVGDRVARITLNPTLVAGSAVLPADAEVVLRQPDVNPLLGLRHI